MVQAELQAVEKNTALDQLEEDMTNLALQEREGIHEPSTSNLIVRCEQPSPESRRHPRADVLLCVVCMEREKKVILLPCRHICMCKACTDKIVGDSAQCPVCREHVVDSIEGFI